MTLERTNGKILMIDELAVWDFAESFTAEEILGLILGTGNHHEKSWEKKVPFLRMEKAFKAAHQEIKCAYSYADVPFNGDPIYEIPDYSPLNLHSLRDQEARRSPTMNRPGSTRHFRAVGIEVFRTLPEKRHQTCCGGAWGCRTSQCN